MNSRQETIDALRRQLSRPRQVVQEDDDTCPSLFAGIPGLKDLCVSSSTQRGLLIEWLSSRRGSGCDALVFLVAREALKRGGVLVVCDESGEFHAVAAQGWGIALEQLIILRPQGRKDLFWACEQTLLCRGVSALLCEFDRLTSNEFRRLQLSAEEGGTVGLLLRPSATQHSPSWAAVRLKIEPRTMPGADRRRVHVELLRCRGGRDEGAVLLEIDHAEAAVRLVSQLAHPANAARPAGH